MWISPVEASTITGAALTSAGLIRAQEVVDLYANRTEAASGGMLARDRYLLGRAVAWQAAWDVQQVAAEGRMGVTSTAGDGTSITVPDESVFVLAPLARRAITRRSWKRPRSLPTTTTAPVLAGDDPETGWSPLVGWSR